MAARPALECRAVSPGVAPIVEVSAAGVGLPAPAAAAVNKMATIAASVSLSFIVPRCPAWVLWQLGFELLQVTVGASNEVYTLLVV